VGQVQCTRAPTTARRMGPLEFGFLAEGALVLLDGPPIIYFLEDHPKFGPRFQPLFEA
jgi:hypothetical protein